MALTKITANIIEDGAISTASLANTSITADKLAATLDLTGKTITVATATAGDNDTTVASTAFVSTAIANLADSAPETLNTLNELAAALGDDANFSTTVTNSIALKAPLANPDFTGTVTADGLTVDGNTKLNGSFTVNGNVDTSASLGEVLQLSQTDSIGGFLWSADRATNTYKNMTYHANVHKFLLDATTEAMRIESSGQILITNETPSIKFVDSGDNSAQFIQAYGGFLRYYADDNNILSGSEHSWWIDGGRKMTLDSSGRLGIGTNSPSSFFADSYLVVGDGTGTPTSTIYGSSTGTSYLFFADGTTGAAAYAGGFEYNHSSDFLDFFANGGSAMRIDSLGRVGIGAAPQSAPYYNNDNPVLTVHKVSGNAILPIVAQANASSAILHLNQAGNRYWRMSAISGGSLTFGGKQPGSGAAESEAMRIESSGNLLLGTTSNSRASKMKIDGSATTGDILQLTGGNSGYIALYISQTAATNHIYCDDTGSVQFYVTTSGNYYFSGASASDRDLKENINTIPDGSLDLIKLLTPRTFNFKAEENFSTNIKTGFIAQEVAEVITEGNVATGTDGQKDMAVDTTGIVAHLVKAIQEQQIIIDDLKSRIETLENP